MPNPCWKIPILPISEIMFQVGFQDLSSFSNFFKHYSGYNPKISEKPLGSSIKSIPKGAAVKLKLILLRKIMMRLQT